MIKTDALRDDSLDSAVEELLANARQVAVAGFGAEAHQALSLLLQDGAWRLPAHGALHHQLARLMPMVSLLAGRPCPAIGDQAAIAVAEQADWADSAALEQIRGLARADRVQQGPAGADWSSDFLSTLVDRRGGLEDPRPHAAFGAFCMDAELVLKARIRAQFGCTGAAADTPSLEDLESLGVPADEAANMLAQLRAAEHIDVAEAAASIGTADIARGIGAYLLSTEFGGGYLPGRIFLASWLLLVEQERDAEALEVAHMWLAQDEGAAALMLDLAAVPSIGMFLRAGKLAKAVQVDAVAAQEWLTALQSRQLRNVPLGGQPLESAAPALQDQTPEGFLSCLGGSPLQDLQWLQVPVLDTGEFAWVASIPVGDRKGLWQLARELMHETGRWPLVTTLWGSGSELQDLRRLGEDLFSRWSYSQGPLRDDLSPRSFIASSAVVDIDEFLAQLAAQSVPLNDEDQLECWRDELHADGLSLSGFDQAWEGCRGDRLAFERWLGEQEVAHGRSDPDRGRQPDFTPDNALLVLLPTRHGEDALAYVHWYGMERRNADGFIALLRHWREQHGAELFAHYGTMLEFVVRRPPQDLDAAFTLARQHELTAPCTLMLPGIPLRHYALGLVEHHEWFLHERP